LGGPPDNVWYAPAAPSNHGPTTANSRVKCAFVGAVGVLVRAAVTGMEFSFAIVEPYRDGHNVKL